MGTLHHTQEGTRERAAFEYDRGWLTAPDRFAIDPALPLVAGPQFYRKTEGGSVFHAAIADTEPDGWAQRVIRRGHIRARPSIACHSSSRAPRCCRVVDERVVRHVARDDLGDCRETESGKVSSESFNQ